MKGRGQGPLDYEALVAGLPDALVGVDDGQRIVLHVGAAETGMGETPNGVLAPYRIDPTEPRAYAVTLRPLSAAESLLQ